MQKTRTIILYYILIELSLHIYFHKSGFLFHVLVFKWCWITILSFIDIFTCPAPKITCLGEIGQVDFSWPAISHSGEFTEYRLIEYAWLLFSYHSYSGSGNLFSLVMHLAHWFCICVLSRCISLYLYIFTHNTSPVDTLVTV